MEDSSIAGRTLKLRREIELIQQDERLYHNQPRQSVVDKEAHARREFRMLQIREELKALVERAKRR